jgi:putative ABC transport system permease protein
VAAPATAVITAVLFTLAPARRAALLDPVQALSRR